MTTSTTDNRPTTITDVLGNTLPVIRFYEDGVSFDCPHCGYSTTAACRYPWCTAPPDMSREAAERLIAESAQRKAEKAARERNHQSAMERIKAEQEAIHQRYSRALAESKIGGWCFYC